MEKVNYGKIGKFILVGLFLLFLIGCSSIDQGHAEWIAKNFVEQRVKFFSTEEEEKKDLPQYNISGITSYKEGKLWSVVLHIESKVKNETKDNDLVVKVNRKGKVVEFDGREIK